MSGAVSTEIYDLTNSWEIVGTFQDADHHSHGFVDLRGHFEQIDIPGATNTFIYGDNDLVNWSEHIRQPTLPTIRLLTGHTPSRPRLIYC